MKLSGWVGLVLSSNMRSYLMTVIVRRFNPRSGRGTILLVHLFDLMKFKNTNIESGDNGTNQFRWSVQLMFIPIGNIQVLNPQQIEWLALYLLNAVHKPAGLCELNISTKFHYFELKYYHLFLTIIFTFLNVKLRNIMSLDHLNKITNE